MIDHLENCGCGVCLYARALKLRSEYLDNLRQAGFSPEMVHAELDRLPKPAPLLLPPKTPTSLDVISKREALRSVVTACLFTGGLGLVVGAVLALGSRQVQNFQPPRPDAGVEEIRFSVTARPLGPSDGGSTNMGNKKEQVVAVTVESRVRDLVKNEADDFRVSAEFMDALNVKVAKVVAEAVERAKSNDRKTLRPGDL